MLKGNRDNETWGKETKRWNRLERRREGKGKREARKEREASEEREARKEREEREAREEREKREAREEREEILEAKERGGYWRREEKRSIFIKKLQKG